LFVPFWILWFYSKGVWIGLGDGKLAIGIGWLLGPVYGLSAIVVAFWIGAIFGLALLLISRLVKRFTCITMKSEIPFGPFLIVGALLILFFQVNALEIINIFI
jgi:leader peptidase (prepilin peptidase)/N-methyltransferase